LPSKQPASLDDILRSLLVETPDVKERDGEYSRGAVVFAARLRPTAVELRLGPEIAEAALNTPNAGPSPRGVDWVTLEPKSWSDASDRLEAWYRVAWRLAGKAQRR
jgi:hypothetical protein